MVEFPYLSPANHTLFPKSNWICYEYSVVSIRQANQAGGMVHKAVQAYEQLKGKGIQVQVINISCLSELDSEAVLKASQTGVIITYEDHHFKTGLGSLVANFLADQGLGIRFRKLGATHYGSSGKPDELYRMQGLDVESLVQAVMDEIKKK